jgi:UDP-N-acetylmuramate--alanine ligase
MVTIPLNSSLKKLPLAHTLPLNVGLIHIVGIGGIGMSGIAEILHNLGYKVQGTDIAENANIARLRNQGINVQIGHASNNIENAAVLVISSAVKEGNVEVEAARLRNIPVVKRSDMLAELMRLKMAVAIAGTHGKTTTTSLTATLLEAGGLQPTIINGGIINALGTNAKVGKGEWMVVEADESDGTFTKIPSTIAVITNIDPEHLDYYGSFEALKAAFHQFVANIPFYGFAVMCLDHEIVRELVGKINDRRVVTYGYSAEADVRPVNISFSEVGQHFTLEFSDRISGLKAVESGFTLPMHGEHNLSNACAAIAVARELGIDMATIKAGLQQFSGVKRRFTKTGMADGVTIIDDYGHHPVEIAATLKSARQAAGTGKVIAVIQPHRFTRVRDLFNEFCRCATQADMVFISEIYTAGEQPIENITRDSLVAGMRQSGHKMVAAFDGKEDLATALAPHLQAGDYVICLGAGSITYWAADLPNGLQQIRSEKLRNKTCA